MRKKPNLLIVPRLRNPLLQLNARPLPRRGQDAVGLLGLMGIVGNILKNLIYIDFNDLIEFQMFPFILLCFVLASIFGYILGNGRRIGVYWSIVALVFWFVIPGLVFILLSPRKDALKIDEFGDKALGLYLGLFSLFLLVFFLHFSIPALKGYVSDKDFDGGDFVEMLLVTTYISFSFSSFGFYMISRLFRPDSKLISPTDE